MSKEYKTSIDCTLDMDQTRCSPNETSAWLLRYNFPLETLNMARDHVPLLANTVRRNVLYPNHCRFFIQRTGVRDACLL